jgi:uncharacterized membrane protein YeaQ/YmgE (transglycosylase-associated protein family)
VGILVVVAIGGTAGWFAAPVMPCARLVRPLMRAAFGAAGALIGAFLTCSVTLLAVSELRATTVLGSAIGAWVVLLVVTRAFARHARRTRRTAA